MSTIECIREFIKSFHTERLLPGFLRAQLSTSQYGGARAAIKRVIIDGEQQTVLGRTSGGMCVHYLVRTDSGELYIVHNASGTLNDAYYFTIDYLKDIFDGFESEMPDWKPSARIQEILDSNQ